LVILADEQTAGRGRMGRGWVAPPGSSLLMSLLLRPSWMSPDDSFTLTMMAGVALCEAVEQAAPLLAAEGMGERVVHRAGNALTDDLGADAYDVVLIAQLVHHFTDEQNRELARRVARALRPGGCYAILDFFRSATPKRARQVPSLFQFYFALTSQSGTWAPQEMASWQEGAELEPRRPIRLRTAPGIGIQAAMKPGR
jgi:SAM-dependent methyltransferase